MAQDLLHGGKKTDFFGKELRFPSMEPAAVKEKERLRKQNMETEWAAIHERDKLSEEDRKAYIRLMERAGEQGGLDCLKKGWGVMQCLDSFREIEKREGRDKEQYEHASRLDPAPTLYDGDDT